MSGYEQVSSGVPQGSHLGPLMFILYINNINKNIQSSDLLLYADDTKIFKIIRDRHDCTLLQEDIRRFEYFCRVNNLFLNFDKCHVITYSRKLNPIVFNYELT